MFCLLFLIGFIFVQFYCGCVPFAGRLRSFTLVDVRFSSFLIKYIINFYGPYEVNLYLRQSIKTPAELGERGNVLV